MSYFSIMRVVVTSRQSLLPIHEAMLAKLIGILALISKNPSNPLFDQYCFESISALVRFVMPPFSRVRQVNDLPLGSW